MIDEAWQSRSDEDFDETHMSRDRIDQYRKWSHCRSSVGTPLSLEQISESDEEDDNKPADPKGEFEDELLSRIKMEAFLQRLPERDRQIFELKMQGLTDQAIAERWDSGITAPSSSAESRLPGSSWNTQTKRTSKKRILNNPTTSTTA